MEVLDANGCKFSLDDVLAVAIHRNELDSLHVGMLYIHSDSEGVEEPRFADLAYHKNIRSLAIPQTLWLKCGLLDINKNILAGHISAVTRNSRQSVPYGLNIKGAKFNEKGEYRPDSIYTGLTCGSFIVTLFNDVGIPLLNEVSWDVRKEEDRRWGKEAIAFLKRKLKEWRVYNKEMSYIKAQENFADKGSYRRYRPEEVACAVHIRHLTDPVKLSEVLDDSKRLNKQAMDYGVVTYP